MRTGLQFFRERSWDRRQLLISMSAPPRTFEDSGVRVGQPDCLRLAAPPPTCTTASLGAERLPPHLE
jgi:hypothetical protein